MKKSAISLLSVNSRKLQSVALKISRTNSCKFKTFSQPQKYNIKSEISEDYAQSLVNQQRSSPDDTEQVGCHALRDRQEIEAPPLLLPLGAVEPIVFPCTRGLIACHGRLPVHPTVNV